MAAFEYAVLVPATYSLNAERTAQSAPVKTTTEAMCVTKTKHF